MNGPREDARISHAVACPAGLLLATSLLLLDAGVAAQVEVQACRRTFFGFATMPETSPHDAFTGVKIVATFRDEAAGIDYAVPVVLCHVEGGIRYFPIWFFANGPSAGPRWRFSVSAEGPGAADVTLPSPRSFSCIPSGARGPWRPHADTSVASCIEERDGRGASHVVFPLTAVRWTLPNPGWSRKEREAVYSHAKAHGANRLKVALTFANGGDPVDAREARKGRPTYDPPRRLSYTVFAKRDPGGTYSATNIDFERFDLDLFRHVETVIEEASAAGLRTEVNFIFNSDVKPEGYDYEGHYLKGPKGPVPLEERSVFRFRHELFAWYLVGRLAAYPEVDYCLMNEHDSPYQQPVLTDADLLAFAETVRQFDPYLRHDPRARIVTTTPARGSAYVTEETKFHRLSSRAPSRALLDAPVPNVVGLQRGGELGWTSILDAIDLSTASGVLNRCRPADAGASPPPVRTLLASRPRPVFIEEDWVMKTDTGIPCPASGVGSESCLCPYVGRRCGAADQRRLPIDPPLQTNVEGNHKFWSDAAWLTGFMSKAYLNVLDKATDDLVTLRPGEAWRSIGVMARFVRGLDSWWLFEVPTAEVVRPGERAGDGSWPELLPRAVVRGRDLSTQYVVYNPSTWNGLEVDLTPFAGCDVPCAWLNPETGERSPPSLIRGGAWRRVPQAAPEYRGRFGEQVLLVNQ